MSASGNEKRQRKIKRTVRLTPMEDALLCTHADLAGLTVASYMRKAALDMPVPRGGRRPSVDHELAARLLAEMGRLTSAFDDAVALAADLDDAAIEAAIRDQLELRLVLFDALGMAP